MVEGSSYYVGHIGGGRILLVCRIHWWWKDPLSNVGDIGCGRIIIVFRAPWLLKDHHSM